MKNNKKSVYISIYKSNLNTYHEYVNKLNFIYSSYKYYKSISYQDKTFESIVERHKERLDYYKLKLKQVVEILRLYKYKIRDADRNENKL